MQEDEYDLYQSEMWNPDYGEQGWQDGFYGQEEEWQPGHDEPAEDEPTEQEGLLPILRPLKCMMPAATFVTMSRKAISIFMH